MNSIFYWRTLKTVYPGRSFTPTSRGNGVLYRGQGDRVCGQWFHCGKNALLDALGRMDYSFRVEFPSHGRRKMNSRTELSVIPLNRNSSRILAVFARWESSHTATIENMRTWEATHESTVSRALWDFDGLMVWLTGRNVAQSEFFRRWCV